MIIKTLFTGLVILGYTLIPVSRAANTPVTLHLDMEHPGALIGPEFTGLSYEAASILPGDRAVSEGIPSGGDGPRYFRPENHALITLFHTLGIKSLRIGGNTSDRNALHLPELADLDSLFGFAKAAEVKVIYCLRLHDGDPALDAATAKYILDHYAGLVDAISIGQEPSAYPVQEVDTRPPALPPLEVPSLAARSPSEPMGGAVEKFPYTRYRDEWKLFAEKIVAAAPEIKFAGPSVHNNPDWARRFIDDFGRDHHVALLTEHLYPGGAAGKLPSAQVGRDRMLSGEFFQVYQTLYDGFAPAARAADLPYRLEEVNSYFNGGASGASDTFAAALWGLEFMYWWAAHEAAGLNFHTGDRVSMNNEYQAPRYATFVTGPDGFDIRPLAYAFKVFDLGAHGRIIPVVLESTTSVNVSAFATLAAENNASVTIINKEHGDGAHDTSVTIAMPKWNKRTKVEMISLQAPHGDAAATTGITLGGASIEKGGSWNGVWQSLPSSGRRGELQINVPAASAVVVRFSK
jgi:Glycosyl hydrolase family 79 C-terminal beta domain